MQGKVEQVGQAKQGIRGPYFSVKVGGTWYSVGGDDTVRQKINGKDICYTVTKAASGNYNAWIKLDAIADEPKQEAEAAPQSGNGNGHAVQWADYEAVAKQAHALAMELEPDLRVDQN